MRSGAPQRTTSATSASAVVGHQLEPLNEAAQGQIALARARRPLDQHAPPEPAGAHRDQAGVADHALASGSISRKTAPITLPSTTRFWALSVPPCASAIWRAMERPSPELPPNAAPFGREV